MYICMCVYIYNVYIYIHIFSGGHYVYKYIYIYIYIYIYMWPPFFCTPHLVWLLFKPSARTRLYRTEYIVEVQGPLTLRDGSNQSTIWKGVKLSTHEYLHTTVCSTEQLSMGRDWSSWYSNCRVLLLRRGASSLSLCGPTQHTQVPPWLVTSCLVDWGNIPGGMEARIIRAENSVWVKFTFLLF